MMRSTKALIYLDHIKHNISLLKKELHSQPLICAAVKADGYGHGIVPVSKTMINHGIDRLAVACIEEAESLRKAGVNVPIHLLSLCLPSEYAEAVNLDLIPFICSREHVKGWQQAAAAQQKKITVHLKIDTGMGRIGCHPYEVSAILDDIKQSPNLFLEGAASHFPSADEDPEKTKDGFKLFQEAIKGLSLKIYHTANTAAIMNLGESNLNMVRPGIMLYGYTPCKEMQQRYPSLKPAMELVSNLLFIKKMTKGSTVSYTGSYTLPEDRYIGTVPIGYADGYFRILSNKSEVLIKGKRYPVVGNVCMDQLMVDLGKNLEVELYDQVTLFGPDSKGPDAVELASHYNGIGYELITALSARVPRVYIGDEN